MKAIRLAIPLALLSAAAFGQDPVFRVDVQLVRILATVKDAGGELISSLTKDDFKIRDNGIAQEVKLFERRTEQPLSISVLIDNSGSTAKDLRFETDSVTRFLRAVVRDGNPDDAVALYSFNWEVRELSGFTRNLQRLERELKKLKGEAGTSLYDAIYVASEELRERDGRHVMIVVTDGGDTVSSTTYHKALEAVHRADAVAYAILVMPITNDAGRNTGGENALAQITTQTGGRVFIPSLNAGLDEAFDSILRELRTQYLIGYYPKNVPASKNRFHQLDIRTTRPNLRVISRTGYYEGSDASGASPK